MRTYSCVQTTLSKQALASQPQLGLHLWSYLPLTGRVSGFLGGAEVEQLPFCEVMQVVLSAH